MCSFAYFYNLREVLSLSDLTVQSSSAEEPWLLRSQGGRDLPVPFPTVVRSPVTARWAPSPPDKSVCWQPIKTLFHLCMVAGERMNPSKSWVYYTFSCGTHVPRPVTVEVNFVSHVKRETSWEHTCRGRYGQYHHEHWASVQFQSMWEPCFVGCSGFSVKLPPC